MLMTDYKKPAAAELRQKLTAIQYKVTQEQGTELAFSGAYHDNKTAGMYSCICCGQPLFDSAVKFDSGTGWPSFYAPHNDKAVGEKEDSAFFHAPHRSGLLRLRFTLGTCFSRRAQTDGLALLYQLRLVEFFSRR